MVCEEGHNVHFANRSSAPLPVISRVSLYQNCQVTAATQVWGSASTTKVMWRQPQVKQAKVCQCFGFQYEKVRWLCDLCLAANATPVFASTGQLSAYKVMTMFSRGLSLLHTVSIFSACWQWNRTLWTLFNELPQTDIFVFRKLLNQTLFHFWQYRKGTSTMLSLLQVPTACEALRKTLSNRQKEMVLEKIVFCNPTVKGNSPH